MIFLSSISIGRTDRVYFGLLEKIVLLKFYYSTTVRNKIIDFMNHKNLLISID